MYDTANLLPVSELQPGVSLLCVGPPMVGKRTFLSEFLSDAEAEEAVILVTTEGTNELFRAALESVECPVGVIDCSGGGSDFGDVPVTQVASPADLTGVGNAITELLVSFQEMDRRVRIGLDSVSTLAAYTEPERLFQFLHAVSSRTERFDGIFLGTIHSDSIDEGTLGTLASAFDGRIEFRESDSGGRTEFRLLYADESEWIEFSPEPVDPSAEAKSEQAVPETGIPTPRSLHELIERVGRDRLRLTICNAKDGAVETLRGRFRGLSIDVESIQASELPESFVVLHRGHEFVAADGLDRLLSATAPDEETAPGSTSPLLSAADGSVFGANVAKDDLLVQADGAGRDVMLRASRTFELLAWRHRSGRIDAGFQRLSVIANDSRTQRVYEGLAADGVETHVYGVPDADLELEGVTVHGVNTAEIADSWFVSYDGPSACGVLLCEERAIGRYHGFWTYRPDLVAAVRGYLAEVY
ncbi:MAG: hypothetical protein PPP58_07970 [Natronomonas sp.]